MILPSALLLGVSLVIPVVDKVPTLNVEQVCQGIAQQGGVSFRDPNIAVESNAATRLPKRQTTARRRTSGRTLSSAAFQDALILSEASSNTIG